MNADRVRLIVYFIICMFAMLIEFIAIAFNRSMILVDKLSEHAANDFVKDTIPIYIVCTFVLSLITILYTKFSRKIWWQFLTPLVVINTIYYGYLVWASLQ